MRHGVARVPRCAVAGVCSAAFAARAHVHTRSAAVHVRPHNSGSALCPSDAYRVLRLARRFVQYEHTTATLGSVNRRDAATAAQWVTRSTREYMAEVDRRLVTRTPSVPAEDANDNNNSKRISNTTATTTTTWAVANARDSKPARSRSFRFGLFAAARQRMLQQHRLRRRGRTTCAQEARTSLQAIHEHAMATVRRELEYMAHDKRRRVQKIQSFFLRQGRAFMFVYLGLYFGTLTLLYLGFASNLLRKDAVYEYLFVLECMAIDRERFFERVAAWDTYVNMGFAFVINEALEVVRLPLALLIFYELRPILLGVSRHAKSSIFRLFAPES